MLRVPRGTTHWFTLCEDRRIRAIRWFQHTDGLDAAIHRVGVDQGYQPLCFGPAYLGPRVSTAPERMNGRSPARSFICLTWRARLPHFRWSQSSCFPMRRAHFSDFFQRASRAIPEFRPICKNWQRRTARRPRRIVRHSPQFESWKMGALPYLLWLMDRDRKSTALKSLQGSVWKAASRADRVERERSSPTCRKRLRGGPRRGRSPSILPGRSRRRCCCFATRFMAI